ncbi:hypothetical protein [Tianweitania sediminis]|uniref:Uncharacterized protein n=1 Tax=Tianweitania sediminis TaxID=1502156 RepID=A0A8J7R680_9HYPH|nr:hypothetical protein [Tianweitania sediminis]MBP0440650.1 hypothetical protein [Tianweitania sediminis]
MATLQVQIQCPKTGAWSGLTTFRYDEGINRDINRRHAIQSARLSASNWTRNYDTFAAMKTRIVETVIGRGAEVLS